MVSIEEQLALLERILNHTDMPSDFYIRVITICDEAYGAYLKLHNIRNHRLYGEETYMESIARFNKEGLIPDQTINALYMEAVLLGLHNLKERTPQ